MRPTGQRRRWPLLVASVAVLAAGGGAGWAVERAASSERTVEDRTGTLAVTVPEAWTVQVDPEQWTPIEGRVQQPSIASGTRQGWNSVTDPAPGVFVGILPGEKLPTRVPQHADCTGDSVGPIRDTQDGDESMTMTFTGCPGTGVTVERVVQVNESQLLWIQIRSDDRATANRVLDSVETFGV